ncbi:lactate dehydrogenase [Defluviimonas sp. 20V17]|uniref:Lactate dehydrogenase n=1 Tax=Allgaiera indica TaxID=765699 RepID=A0AAN4UP75_9RHOB|nr:2-hydroxyacid dehydrogenase [Allgaiera indica]KDB04569.1 lactate dehydrogenase [Defluviimonas sp. 20V17]GHD99655.1 lactate dehydrogenase [Allgaiera indica]SDW21061.1 Lactate dehydrogenase [Allgaiera indica]
MAKVLAIGTFPEQERAALQEAFATAFLEDPAELADLPAETRAQVAAVALRTVAAIGGAAMDLLPQLGLIASYGVGYDQIDLVAATARGVAVTNTPDVLNDDVADLAVAMLLMQGRRMEAASAWMRAGRWASDGPFALNRRVSGGRAGILGLGRIGREIADRLAAFKMQIHYHSRHEKQTPGWTYHADPVALAAAVDFLFVAVVGGAETEGLVSAEVIAALGARGVLINIARGSVVDEAALLDALEAGRLGGAGLDVFRNEPVIDPRFYALPNVVLQPHQASATVETRGAMARLQRDNLAAYLAGTPLPTPVA